MSKKEQLLELGFLSGSQYYGTATKESDIDIVFCITEKQKVLAIIDNAKITESEYNGGCYFDEGEEKINCIFVHPNEFDSWLFATVTMKTMLAVAEMDKQTKVNMFQILRAMFNNSEAKLKGEAK